MQFVDTTIKTGEAQLNTYVDAIYALFPAMLLKQRWECGLCLCCTIKPYRNVL